MKNNEEINQTPEEKEDLPLDSGQNESQEVDLEQKTQISKVKKYWPGILLLAALLIIFGVVLSTDKDSDFNSENYSYVISPPEDENCRFSGYDIDCIAQLLIKDKFGETQIVIDNVYDIFEDSSEGVIDILNFSEDLERVLFINYQFGYGRVYLYDLNSKEYQMTAGVDAASGSKVSPDGTKMLTIVNRKIISIIDLWTGNESMSISPEDGKSFIQFINTYGGEYRGNYAWSSDSKGFCYYVYDANEDLPFKIEYGDFRRTPIDHRCTEGASLDEITWSGSYELGEFAQGGPGSNQTWRHQLSIEEGLEGSYKINFNTDGFQTLRRVIARGEANGGLMNVYFVSNAGVATTPSLKEGHLLFRLTPSKEGFNVYWIGLKPMLESSETLFEKSLKTYQNEEYGFEFEYPAQFGDMNADPKSELNCSSDNKTVRSRSLAGGSYGLYSVITCSDQVESPQGYMGSPSKIIVLDREAYVFDYVNTVNYHNKEVYISLGDGLYLGLNHTYKPGRLDYKSLSEHEFEQIITSFRFTD